MSQSFPVPLLTKEYSTSFPLLVVGLPGVPGYNAFFYLKMLFPNRVGGIVPPNAPSLLTKGSLLIRPGKSPDGTVESLLESGLLPLDPENPHEVDQLFETIPFQAVVDASGWCALKPCELDPALGRRLNVDVGVNIMRAAKRVGARLIRLSTDLVFDGKPYVRDGQVIQGNYLEDSPVSPVTMYGKLMAESEIKILEEYPETAVLRIALPMGPSFSGYAGAIDWIESRFRKGRPATLYLDEVRSNLYVQDLNRVILSFLNNKANGIYHVGGPQPLSLFQIAQAINKLGNYPAELLMGCMREAAGPMPPRAGDVTMNIDKLVNLVGSDMVRRWPFKSDQKPPDLRWHHDRNTLFPESAIAKELYGYGWPEAWDHPGNLIPPEFAPSQSHKATIFN